MKPVRAVRESGALALFLLRDVSLLFLLLVAGHLCVSWGLEIVPDSRPFLPLLPAYLTRAAADALPLSVLFGLLPSSWRFRHRRGPGILTLFLLFGICELLLFSSSGLASMDGGAGSGPVRSVYAADEGYIGRYGERVWYTETRTGGLLENLLFLDGSGGPTLRFSAKAGFVAEEGSLVLTDGSRYGGGRHAGFAGVFAPPRSISSPAADAAVFKSSLTGFRTGETLVSLATTGALLFCLFSAGLLFSGFRWPLAGGILLAACLLLVLRLYAILWDGAFAQIAEVLLGQGAVPFIPSGVFLILGTGFLIGARLFTPAGRQGGLRTDG